MNPPSERRFPRLPLAKAQPHAKARSREEEKSQTEFPSPAFLRSFVASRETYSTPAAFLEDLIDACVMESYFREHMAGRDLLFHATVAQIFEATHTKARSHEEGKAKSEFPSQEFLRAFVSSCETSPIRNRLLRLTAASPDLLAIIKQEGKV